MVNRFSKLRSQSSHAWSPPSSSSRFRSGGPKGYTLKNYLLLFLGFLLAGGVLAGFLIYVVYLRDLPPITAIESGGISESTIIYDKNGQELYKMHNSDGRRTYVLYDDISQSIKDAIVSAEDKTFFTNPGIDFFGLMRAIKDYVTGEDHKLTGASTISQQLIKNLFLTNERSLRRKVREAVLSYQLNSRYTKEKILELYLNTISFGNNASGIEEAAKTYFGKSAKDVGVLGATILASLPKGPSYYSPYTHRDRLMGSVYVYDVSEPENHITLDSPEAMLKYSKIYTSFKKYLQEMYFTARDGSVMICNLEKGKTKLPELEPNSEGCVTIGQGDLLTFLNNIRISGEIGDESGEMNSIALEYEAGRKDFVAMRMYIDGKISNEQYHDVLVNGLEFPFQRYTELIRYPYFVFYIKEYLEKTYGEDIDITNGLRVYTTIDPDLQSKAEEIVRKGLQDSVNKWGVSSAALVSMDNSNGHILAMVGGPNYYDEKNGGNNNMATSPKVQPGSSFKPIVYSLAIARNPIGPDSPVTDNKTKFGSYEPDNYDKKFMGMMTLAKALGYSRNIPAVKMFYLAGQQNLIVQHANSLGINTIKTTGDYGASMALGAVEVRPLDMMQAYSVFANNGIKRDVTGIIKVEDANGNTLESHEINEGREVFSPAASYIIAKMISDNNSRPVSDFWRNALSLVGGRIAGAKTGTSNKKIKNSTTILPRDLWTIGFTPQITTAVWAGNVDGRETKGNADGLNVAAPIWKEFMNYAHTNLKKIDFTRPDGVYDVVISRTSGKLAQESTPSGQRVKTIMAMKPDNFDEGTKTLQIDILCGGPTSENTPEEDIRSVFVPQGKPLIDGFESSWYTGGGQNIGYLADGTTIHLTKESCERPGAPGNVAITLRPAFTNTAGGRRLLEITWSGDRNIRTLRIYQGNTLLFELNLDTPQATGLQRASVDLVNMTDILTVQVVDMFGFRYSNTLSIDENPLSTPGAPTGYLGSMAPPTITMMNPVSGDRTISIYADQFFNLRFGVTSSTPENDISVSLNGTVVRSMKSGNSFVIPINEGRNIPPGTYPVTIQVVDGNKQTISQSIQLTILPR